MHSPGQTRLRPRLQLLWCCRTWPPCQGLLLHPRALTYVTGPRSPSPWGQLYFSFPHGPRQAEGLPSGSLPISKGIAIGGRSGSPPETSKQSLSCGEAMSSRSLPGESGKIVTPSCCVDGVSDMLSSRQWAFTNPETPKLLEFSLIKFPQQPCKAVPLISPILRTRV